MKNRVNKKIFKALALAIAATMALSSPISVVAEDGVHQNVINDYDTDAKSSPNEKADEYHNIEQSDSAEANYKRTESAAAQTAAAEAASIAASVENAVDVEARQKAADKAEAKVDAAEAAASKLDGVEATDTTEKVTGQKEIVQGAIDDAKDAIRGNEEKNIKGVQGEVNEANAAASTANSAYNDLVTAAGNNASSAWETVNGTKDKDGAADKLDDLKNDVNEYNAEVNKDQWGVYGDAFGTNVNNWNNLMDVAAVNETTAELNEKIEAAKNEDDLRALKADAKANVEAAEQAVSDAKENLEAAIAKYNNYAMKYNLPLYGKDKVEYTAEDVAAAGITQMSLDEINSETWQILMMQISEQEIGTAATAYVNARNAYYGAASDVPAAYFAALQKLGIAYEENQEALDLEKQIDANLNGEDNYTWEWKNGWPSIKKEHVDGAVDYLEDAELTKDEVDAIIAMIQEGNDKADKAIEKGENVVEYDVDKAKAALNKTNDDIAAINVILNGKEATDGEEAVVGLYAQISAKSGEVQTQSGVVSAKNTAVTNVENQVKASAGNTWDNMSKKNRVKWVLNHLDIDIRHIGDVFRFKENYIKHQVDNNDSVKAARSERDTEQRKLNTLNGQLTDLNNQKTGYETQLSQLNTTKEKQNAELTAAQNELKDNANLNEIKDAKTAELRKIVVDRLRDEYLKTSDKINQTEFDEDLYKWSEDPRFWNLISQLWNKEAGVELNDAKSARSTLNSKYSEREWRKFVDKYELIQWIAGTDNLRGNIESVLKVYKQQLDEVENNYYDGVAQDAIQSANETKARLSAANDELGKDSDLNKQISNIQSRIDALNERGAYTDRSAEINALTAELNRLTFSVNGLIENNVFDIRNAQLAGSIMAIENAKKALFGIKMEALKTRGSVKKIDLVSLEWAIKWAEGEVYLATLAQGEAQAALDKLPADKQDTTGNDDTTGGDDTTTGGGDDTTYIPGVTPRVTPIVANEGEAVLGEARTTTRRSARKSATAVETAKADNNTNNAEVAGAKKEETKTPAVEETKEIEETETALAATPELQEKSFAWWWLLILAAIIAISVEEYARRKHNKAKVNK